MQRNIPKISPKFVEKMKEKIWFKNKKGLKLCAYLMHRDNIKKVPAVIFAHGLYSGKESSRNYRIAEQLVSNNFASLLIDFSGHGESEGTPEDDFLSQQIDDLDALLDHVQTLDVIDKRRIGVNGSSTGGIVAMMKSINDDRIKVLCLRAPPSQGFHGFAAQVRVPMMIIQGEMDPLFQENKRLFDLLTCEKKFEVVKGAGHLFKDPKHEEQMVKITVDWFVSHLFSK